MAKKSSREEIESRAYEIYIQQGRVHGHDLEHWLMAERELNGTPESEPERDPRSVIRPTTSPTSSSTSTAQQKTAVAGRPSRS